jgi:nitrite reductase/ring-hydroxylating ferredoxin subunit
MAKQITVCPVSDLPPGMVTGAGPYAVGNIDGKYFAVTRRCRHLRADLAGGSIEDGRLVCPWHQSAYDVENGQMVRGPHQDPRTRNDVQDADESLASWTRHRIGVRQRYRRRIAGAPARFTSPFGGPRPHPRSAKPYVASLDWLTMADQSIGCDCLWALARGWGSTYSFKSRRMISAAGTPPWVAVFRRNDTSLRQVLDDIA